MSSSPAIPAFAPGSPADAVAAGFRRSGAGLFENLWPPERIAAVLGVLEQRYPELGNEDLIEPARVQHISNRRYVVPITVAPDCLDLLLQPDLQGAFAALLGPDWVYDSVGVIVSFPGARQQGVHRDSEPLFGGIAIEAMLPPFALTLAVPLRAMDAVLGSTGFWPGTHILGVEPTGDEAMITPEVQPGSCAVWNYRISHCGMENRGDLPRPLLYATACRPFWAEYRNDTPSGSFAVRVEQGLLETLAPQDRARFRRAVAV